MYYHETDTKAFRDVCSLIVFRGTLMSDTNRGTVLQSNTPIHWSKIFHNPFNSCLCTFYV